VRWNAELVDQWLHLRGGLQVSQSANDPLAARSAELSTLNRLTTTRLNLSPSIERRLSPDHSLSASLGAAYTHRQGDFASTDDRRDFLVQDHRLSLERQPSPLGYALEASYSATRYEGDDQPALVQAQAQAVLSYAPSPEWRLGLSAGRESARFALAERDHGVWGLRVQWRPTERTSLSAQADDRFFGRGWDLQFNHRMPALTLGLRWVRRVTAQPVSQLLGDSATAAGQLDAMLTTRYPDAAERATQLRQLLAQLRLPADWQGPLELYSDAARVEQGADLSLLFVGRATTLQLSGSLRRFTELRSLLDPLAPAATGLDNSRAGSLDLLLRRRVTPLTQLDLALSHSRVQSLVAGGGSVSQTSQLRLGALRRLSARTDLSASLRAQRLASRNLATAARENAVTLGLSHRF
jgi:uncharacterized protein (PEP-CTERM system associated)